MSFSLSRRAVTLSAVFAVTAAAASSAGLLWTTSCQQQPIDVPVVTFERAQKMDVVCMHVLDPDPADPSIVYQRSPEPALLTQCAPVAANQTGALLPFHLFALVTQTARGELAAVDLTAGHVVDEDVATPGINFIPVGALPTDVAVTPDGNMAFVTSAEINKPALYGVPTAQILGNSQGLARDKTPAAPRLTSFPVCAFEQAPIAVTVVPRRTTPGGGVATDAGAGDAAAAPTTGGSSLGYDIVVVLPGVGNDPGQVLLMDPAPFLNAADIRAADGTPFASALPNLNKGELLPCHGVALNLGAQLPATAPVGKPWDDGVTWVDGGVDLSGSNPALGASCTTSASDAGTTALDAEAEVALPVNSGALPRAAAIARDEQTLYIADSALPLIHVIDLSTPGTMRELAPLIATSTTDQGRSVSLGAIAVSPITRAYRRFVYAVDKNAGNLMVFDVTTPTTEPSFPMIRPHAELNPFQPIDRINFGAPVATVAFVKHDWPIDRQIDTPNGPVITRVPTSTGLLCNPNPNAGTSYLGPYSDPGANYRPNSITPPTGIPLGPGRLRGVFAFATLTSGQVITIDVDDWDAPCRRPDPMSLTSPWVSAIVPPQPSPVPATTDRDPYHTPTSNLTGSADQGIAVSLEAFFPASAPHRARSFNLLRRDPTLGTHIPVLAGSPILTTTNQTLATTGTESPNNPVLLPTRTTFADPTYTVNPTLSSPEARGTPSDLNSFAIPQGSNLPGVRFAWEDPLVHFDQDWTVAYEGSLPGFDGLRTIVTSRDDDQSLDLVTQDGLFCRRGVEDARLGKQRIDASLAAAGSDTVYPARIDRQTADYVQVTNEVLANNDPYWQLNPTVAGDDGAPSACWSDTKNDPQDAVGRQAACLATFGLIADELPSRDFPILEAYENRLVVGRYGEPAGAPKGITPQNREIVGRDPSNKPFLKAMRCCFAQQVAFRIRTGGEWVAVGSAIGYLHHIVADTTPERSCVQSCKSTEVLLNSRSIEVPRPRTTPVSSFVAPDRNSALAMRNPMFSYVMWAGKPPIAPDKTNSLRSYVWRFTTRGQFVPLSVNLAATTTAVSPQSMRFIDTLGKLAVVDGNSQGLVLIDLNRASADAPYY